MATAPAPRRLTVEEYLAMDRASTDVRYEYYDGQVRAMAGGSLDHSAIKVNCVIAFGVALRGKGCRVFDTDARVQVSATRYVYPDITVSCSSEDQGKIDIIKSPRVVIEVLSPGTSSIDKGRKLDYYRACQSIEDYVLIESQQVKVEVYHRIGAFLQYSALGLADTLDLPSIGVQIPISEIYLGLTLPLSEDDL